MNKITALFKQTYEATYPVFVKGLRSDVSQV